MDQTSIDAFNKMSEQMNGTYADMLRKVYRDSTPDIDDWKYADLPYLSKKYWEELCAMIGLENMRIAAGSVIPSDEHVSLHRATIFISPTGLRNLREFLQNTI